MLLNRKLLLLIALFSTSCIAFAQRSYKTSSVLASGNWYKIGTTAEGVYKIDLPFLNTLGITGSIPSSAIRIFGAPGGMLSEAALQKHQDDLDELAIQVVDGGDGQLNGTDYVLFYSRGPHQWLKDSANRRFQHKKNLYSDKAYYFISVGGSGKRIQQQPAPPSPVSTVTSFDERYFHELDTVNFLSSGKEWLGEEFSGAPGRTLSRSFTLPIPDVMAGQPATLVTHLVARSINTPSSFHVLVNGQPLPQVVIPQISSGLYDLFAQQVQSTHAFTAAANPNINIIYTPGSFNSQGWLNWFEFFSRRVLSFQAASQLLFRDWSSVGGAPVQFVISNGPAAAEVWDVTEPLEPVRMQSSVLSGSLRFTNHAQRLHEYVGFSSSFLLPSAEGRVPNQNLHSTSEKDFIIISHSEFLPQAQRLADFHAQQNNLRTVIVPVEQVYNEFAGGSPDPTALRDYVKMYHDRYQANWNASRRYLLLFGKASFDYKGRIRTNTNLVPAYESAASLDPLATYTSDDFFGFLEDHEDVNTGVVVNTLDIGIGRVPAKNIEEARNFVDKVLDYHSPAALGPWRNNIDFIADDEDFNLHVQDAETLSTTVRNAAPVLNQQKIYLDAFRQEGGSAGGRYPQANAMVNNNIYNGTLIWNYSGHGGPPRLAEEVVIDQSIVNRWNNQYRLPLFITATCDFAPFDNPTVNSLGENLLVRPKTGAIALMTTTRVVFAFSNLILNNNYLRFALQPDAAGRYKSLGEAMLTAKNFTYQNSGDATNTRKFSLLGDPAMTLGFPTLKVSLDSVNGKSVAAASDTLSATEFVTLKGSVRDLNGAVQDTFSGRVYVSVFDKPRTILTLGNDATSSPVPFSDQNNLAFRGKATVANGRYSISFRMPKDINFQYGQGKVSLYAENGKLEGNGFSNQVVIGSIATSGLSDQTGPQIKAFLNDDRFVNGSIVNPSPILILDLFDSSGINTGSAGIDHDIVATLDNNNDVYYVLNNFYETDLDNYQKGKVRFQLPELSAGVHTLKIKAWDVVNNSSEYFLHFTVVESGELRIDHVLNYPNPFTTRTNFWFEHNHPGVDLYSKVEIFTVSGKLIKTLTQTINTPGNRSMELSWDGTDDYGAKIGRGVYIYRVKVRSIDGKTAEKWERLVIL